MSKKEKAKRKSEEITIKTSFLKIDDKTIAEQVYNPETNKSHFIEWSTEKRYHHDNIGRLNWEIVDRIKKNNITYKPINDNMLLNKVVRLPSHISPYTTTADLLKEIKAFIHKYCDVTPNFLTFASWYVLLTWVYDKMNTVPYLRLRGDTGTGKTRIQQTIGGICYKACFVAGALTPAPVFRLINIWKGTIIIDEADFKKSDENSEIITILNCGYQRGTPVIRCKQNDADQLLSFEVFCPKIIGTRQGFKDKALESRCLTEITRMTDRKDIPADTPSTFWDEQLTLRNKLLQWRLGNYFSIDPDNSVDIDLGDLEPRLRQATGSFANLFASIPEVLDNFKQFLKEYQAELISDRANTFDGTIVRCIAKLLVDGKEDADGNIFPLENISSADISAEMKNNGWDTNSRSIGLRLKSLSIDTKLKRISKKVKRFLVIDNRMIKIFKRYIDDLELLQSAIKNVTSVTSVTSVTDTEGGKNILFNYDIIPTKNRMCNISPLYPHTDVTLVTHATKKEKSKYELLKKSLDPKEEYEEQLLIDCYGTEAVNLARKNGNIYASKNGRYRVLQ